MELKMYFSKIRNVEAQIAEEFPIVVSKETPDGGKPGVCTEVPRRIAAKLIVEGMAEIASEGQAKRFRDEAADAKRLSDQIAAINRIQLSVLTASELDRLTAPSKD